MTDEQKNENFTKIVRQAFVFDQKPTIVSNFKLRKQILLIGCVEKKNSFPSESAIFGLQIKIRGILKVNRKPGKPRCRKEGLKMN